MSPRYRFNYIYENTKLQTVIGDFDYLLKNLLQGVKPAALEKVTNLQMREFIEKCLVPASERKSARELLKDPFMHCNNSREMKQNKIPPPKSQSGTSAEEILLNIEAECQSDSVYENGKENNIEPPLPSLELIRTNEDNEFWLKGERQDENTVYFFMHISSLNGTYLFDPISLYFWYFSRNS